MNIPNNDVDLFYKLHSSFYLYFAADKMFTHGVGKRMENLDTVRRMILIGQNF